MKQSLLFPIKIFWSSYPEPCLCHCRQGHEPFLLSFCSTRKRVFSIVLHCILYLWASRQQRAKQSVEGMTLRRGDMIHVQKCAMKTNAQEIWAGELVGYVPWHFLHNWKFIALMQDGPVPSPMPLSSSSLVRQPLQVWSQIWKNQESTSYLS